MAANGNDTNPGTQSAPVKTLVRAYAVTPSGGTLVIRGGTYRDGTTTRISKTITIQPYPHEQVWFDGMDVPTGWTSASNNQWTLNWSTPSYCNGHYYDTAFRSQTANGPCTYYDQYGDTSNPLSPDPQMVYIDGMYIHEVATAAEAVGNNFYYNQPAHSIVLGTNPAGHVVEVTARPTAIFIEGGPGSVTIRGIGFAHYASDNFADAAGHGAVIVNSPNSTFENDVFAENAGAGLQFADPRNGVIRGVYFWHNGANGIDANGHQKSPGITDNLLMENNVFDGNNAERFGVGCSYSCEASGSKWAHIVGGTVKNNIFKNGIGTAHGWWCDMACTNVKVVNNAFMNNGGDGVFYEISDTGIIASNLIVGNGVYGIKMGSANTKIYNNTVVSNGVGALVYDDNRSVNHNWGTDAGPDTVNVDMANNIFSMNRGNIVQSWRTDSTYGLNTGPNTFYSNYDYNSYYRSGTTPYVSEWRDGTQFLYSTVAALTAGKGKEVHGQDITSGSDPFFMNASAGDYRLRTTSVAYNTGMALPADVATALGIAASPVSRGAMNWPGQQQANGGDVNNDGRVNALDLSILISHDGQNFAAADFNHDGTVGAADLAILLSKWTW